MADVILSRGTGKDKETFVSDDPTVTTQLIASGWGVEDAKSESKTEAPKTASKASEKA